MLNAIINTGIFGLACFIFYVIITSAWTKESNKQIDEKMPVILGKKKYYVFNEIQMRSVVELVNNSATLLHHNKVLLALLKEATKDEKGKE